MSDENTTAPAETPNPDVPAEENEAEAEQKKPAEGKDLSELSPEDLLKAVKFWKSNARNREDEVKALKTDAEKWQQYQESQKTELEKAQEKAQKLEQTLAQYELKTKVLEAQKKYNLPDSVLPFLEKSTAESLDADAESLSKIVVPVGVEAEATAAPVTPATRSLPVNPLQGANSGNQPQKAESFSQALGRALREASKK